METKTFPKPAGWDFEGCRVFFGVYPVHIRETEMDVPLDAIPRMVEAGFIQEGVTNGMAGQSTVEGHGGGGASNARVPDADTSGKASG